MITLTQLLILSSSIFDNNGNFQHCKKHGVGRKTILKFLGGNWKQQVNFTENSGTAKYSGND